VDFGVVEPSTLPVPLPLPDTPDPPLVSRGVLPPGAVLLGSVPAPTAPVDFGVVAPSTLPVPLPLPATPDPPLVSRGVLPPAAELLEPVPAPAEPVLVPCALTETAAAARNTAAAAPTMTCLANDRCDGTAFMATPLMNDAGPPGWRTCPESAIGMPRQAGRRQLCGGLR
jgi:hypothetical protein